MFTKLVLLTLFALSWAKPHAPAAKYPAGVNPHDCPNYPYCDNVHLHSPSGSWHQPHQSWHSQSSWHPKAQWNSYAPSWQAYSHWGDFAAGHGGAKYPAGVNPHSCPNYPFCDVHAGGAAGHVAPLPGWNKHQYPAGVSPHSCPNFPYCH